MEDKNHKQLRCNKINVHERCSLFQTRVLKICTVSKRKERTKHLWIHSSGWNWKGVGGGCREEKVNYHTHLTIFTAVEL